MTAGAAISAPSAEDREFDLKVLSGLKVGELHPRVVEDRADFMIVRLLARDGAGARLEGVVIPKLAFDRWFDTESRRVPLTVTDPAMRQAILANVEVPYLVGRLTASD